MAGSRHEQDKSSSESDTEHDNGGSSRMEGMVESGVNEAMGQIESAMEEVARPAEEFLSKTRNQFTSDKELFREIEQFAGEDQRMNRSEFNAFMLENGFKRKPAAKLWARLEKDKDQTVSVAIMKRENKYLRELPRYVWFKFACTCTWISMISSCVVFTMSLSAVAAISDVKVQICSEPAIESTNKSCAKAMQKYAGCLARSMPLASEAMRDCFMDIGDQDESDLAYNLAERYTSTSISARRARELLQQEIDLSRRRKRRLVAISPARGREHNFTTFASVSAQIAPRGSMGGARVALSDAPFYCSIPTQWAARVACLTWQAHPAIPSLLFHPESGDSDTAHRLLRENAESSMEASDQLLLVYDNLAVGSTVALVSSDMLRPLFLTLALSAVATALIPGLLSLRSLGNRPQHWCFEPKNPERMRKVGLRCSCHLGWALGFVLLVCSTVFYTQYQVLLRYVDGTEKVPNCWGESSVMLVAFPCFFGMWAGIVPAFNAMILSRARAERREVVEYIVNTVEKSHHHHKKLTGPIPTGMGPQPSPVMLQSSLDIDVQHVV